jgi:uncharacterized protein YtpQ (UPF0354 family)
LEVELDRDAACHGFDSSYTVSILSRMFLNGLRRKIKGQVICAVKHADGLALLDKEQSGISG